MRHVCQGHRLEACIYTPSFFKSFPIHNHNLHLQALSFHRNIFSLLIVILHLCKFATKMLRGGSEVSWRSCPFGPFRMYCAQLLPDNKPMRINAPKSFALPPQSSSQMLPPQRMGGAGRSALRPQYHPKKNPHLRAPQLPPWSLALVATMVNARGWGFV